MLLVSYGMLADECYISACILPNSCWSLAVGDDNVWLLWCRCAHVDCAVRLVVIHRVIMIQENFKQELALLIEVYESTSSWLVAVQKAV